jgi:hypothetical protein
MRFTTDTAAGYGRRGGKATLARYGKAHMVALGKAGVRAMAARHFGGDIREAMKWLRSRGLERAIDRGVDVQLDRALASGAEVASVELPWFDDDLDPSDEDGFLSVRHVAALFAQLGL